MSFLLTLLLVLGVWYLRRHPEPIPPAPTLQPLPESPSAGAHQESQDKPPPSEDRLRATPVEEPIMPQSSEEAKTAGYTLLKGGGYLFERKDGVEGVAVPATVLVTRGLIELFACGAGGKEHESLLRLDCDTHSLDSALTLCGFRRGRLPKELRERGREIGDRLVVLVQWKSKDDRVVTHRAEDLILHVRREGPMPRVGWTFVGSWMEVVDPTSTPRERKTYKVLAASVTRCLMTTWRDASALLDNPIPDAVDDTVYAANYVVAPRSGTSVLVLIRPPNAKEREEIAKAEEELSK